MEKRTKRLLDRVWGPLGSVLLHVLIVMLLFKLAGIVRDHTEFNEPVTIVEMPVIELDELPEFDPAEQLPDAPDILVPPQVDPVDAPPQIDDFEDEKVVDNAHALEMLPDVSILVLKDVFINRTPSARAAVLNEYDPRNAKAIEVAVVKALRWLKEHQNPDGSWGARKQTGYTGLGLLTFLAHGETLGSEEYGRTVEKAVRYLVSRMGSDGKFRTDATHGANHSAYEHAIATYAICEAYGITRVPALKPVMEGAIGVVIDGQQANGGWTYGYKQDGRADMSIGGWQVQALKAASAAGASHPDLQPAMKRAVAGLRHLYLAEAGSWTYALPQKSPRRSQSMTGVGILSMQLLGQATDKMTQQAIRTLREAECSWQEKGNWSFYSWYYITQAKFHHGRGWKQWNADMVRTLTRNQADDGSWDPARGGIPEKGEAGQPSVYSTTLAALTLQVYYRVLPTYKAVAVKEVERGVAEEADEIEIEII